MYVCVCVCVWHALGLRLSGPKQSNLVLDPENWDWFADIGLKRAPNPENWVASASRCLGGRTNAASLNVLYLKGWMYRDAILEPLLPCMRTLRVSGHSVYANVRGVCDTYIK